MSTRGIADVVFCIDASASMQPCIDSVRKNLMSFVEGLKADKQITWDLRLDFLAHRTAETTRGPAFDFRSLFYSDDDNSCWEALYLKPQTAARFFTSNTDEFRAGLNHIQVQGDEAALVALDYALDFPWRDASQCHRVIIMLTDEPFEQGELLDFQTDKLRDLVDKIHALRVMLFLVAPESAAFEKLSEADRSEWEVVESCGDGLATVDFTKVLSYIGKSVSKAHLQQEKPPAVKRGLFGQAGWRNAETTGYGEHSGT